MTPRRLAGLLAILSFALEQTPAFGALIRAPYVQMLTETSATLVWRTGTDSPADSKVSFGTSVGARNQVATGSAGPPGSNPNALDHVVTLEGLTPGTRYFYDVGTVSGGIVAGGTANDYFRTAPEAGSPRRFLTWIVCDSGDGGTAQRAVRDAMLAETGTSPPDLFVHCGDMAYQEGTDLQFTQNFFTQYRTILAHTVVWPTPGDHELVTSNAAAETGPYFEAFVLPAAGEAGGAPSGAEAFYAFDYANAHFVSLESSFASVEPGSPMMTWLASDLAANSREWTIVFFHHAPYTKGSHDSDLASDSEGRLVAMREKVLPILEEAGVDLVITGDSHVYERSYLIDGGYGYGSAPNFATPAFEVLVADGVVLDEGDGDPAGTGPYVKAAGAHGGTVYVVTGHGGRATPLAGLHPVMVDASPANGSGLMEIDGSRLTFRNLLATGVIEDTFSIEKISAIALQTGSVKSACGSAASDSLVIPGVSVASRPNRVLVVTVAGKENDADCNVAHPAMAVSYRGLRMTLAAAAVSNTVSMRLCNGIFYLHDPPVGTGNVTISFPATMGTPIDNRQAGALLLYNVADGPPEAAKTAGANTNTNPVTTAIQTLTDGAWVVDIMSQGSGRFTTTQTGQIERWDTTCGGSSSATSTKEVDPAASTALGWSHSNPKRYAHTLVAFAPASPTTLPPSTTTTTLPPAAPVALDAPSLKHACNGSPGDSLVIPAVPVAARPNRVLVVTVGAEEDDADCNLAHAATRVSYGGLPMTHAVAALSGTSSWRACNGIFYLHNPPVGVADVTISFPTTVGTPIDNRHAGAFLLYNVAAGPPQVTKAAGANATTNPVANSIQTPTSGAWVVDAMTQGNAGTFAPTQVGQVQRWERSCGTSASATSTKEATSLTTSVGWSHSAPKRWAHAVAVFAPAN